MDTINGIDFKNWAAACAHIANGMSGEEVCKTLQVEMPVWEEANLKWGEKLADLMTADMNVATEYAEIFANPNVGKFASSEAVADIDETLKKVPDYDTYQKITWHFSKASEVGADGVGIIESYGLTMQQWGQIGMHYSNEYKEKIGLDDNGNFDEDYSNYTTQIMQKWENYWEDHYKNQNTDLAGDIDF